MTEANKRCPHERFDHASAICDAIGRSRSRFVLAVLIIGLGLGCAGNGFDLLAGRKPLRVGISPSYPPVIFENDGEIMGIEADLARIVGETLGRRIDFERFPQSDLLSALERGEVDVVMSGLSIPSELSEHIRFTTPYMKIGQLALIRTSELVRLGQRRMIRRNGARIGYQRGTSGERFVATELTRSTSFAFDDVDSGIRSLRAGRIDYFVHDAPTIWRLAGDPDSMDLQGLYHPLTEEHLAWAVRAEDTKLLALLDATLSHWKREGLIEPIVNRWIPVRVTLR